MGRVIVPRAPEWEELFVANGCAVACEPGDAQDLARTFRWLSEHRDEVRRMGETGRRLVEQRWNYETQFAKVLALMEQ
jgi:spore maturation protein CgeB